ncbi:3-hydroxyacyl-CoA dehydrogenase family protein [Mechercharimyces sp. CAU 1602]|uniref:3-hydroxyacyl-CoA dehydrogenase family protein n=1 Tax=Mechercharimyces sp. CAU 1602 TaxID=2973933 RepID=UPI0021615C60|nr:3-hydroxyacyl-CoA dehydrogenase family protein [Mechercharimyces sp. CAU 1602]MCS1351723.1 3-hydroxyacyl-CoA dehydrogenase family protein [Mechercharimyces sp. CAU 1602]
MRDRVWLIGEGPLLEEMYAFLNERDWQVVIEGEPLRERRFSAVVDVRSGAIEEKETVLRRVEEWIDPSVPIFSSALHVSATRIASWLKHPQRIYGFSPLLMAEKKIMEVSRPMQAEEEGWEKGRVFWERMGMHVEVVGDEPGLVFPRTLALLVNEAALVLNEGIASREDIDRALCLGMNLPTGPLSWADRVGIDQVIWVLTGLVEELGDDRYRPTPLLRRMVYAGRTGVAVGRGFYTYEESDAHA